MIVTYLRSSSWGSHDFCPMKYFAVYGLGWQEIPKCKTENGTITHKVLEILGKIKKCKQDGLNEYDDDIMGKINIHDYDLNHITDVCFAYYYNKSANTAIRKKDFAEKGFCPENFHHIFHKDFCKKDFFVKGKFVDGIVAIYPQIAAKLLDIRANPTNYSMDDFVHLYRSAYLQDCHSWVDKAITFDGGRFDPRNHHIVDAEIRFDVEIMQPWAMYDYNGVQGLLALKGTIDQVNQINESTYEILDWKGLPLDTLLPTPAGWTTMKDVAVGDTLFDQYGKQCKVVGKSQVHNRECFKITFSDKTSVECDNVHLWKLSNGDTVPVTDLKIGDEINVCLPIECDALPIEDSELKNQAREIDEYDIPMPAEWLRASIRQRYIILDEFCLATYNDGQLADILHLMKSLGYQTKTDYKSYRDINNTKLHKFHTIEHIKDSPGVRFITNIESAPKQDTQCIAVDSPDNTYLCTEHFIPTHNTGRKYDWGKDKEKTYETLQDDPQLRMYHYVCHRMFPYVDNVFVTIYFINDGGPISLCYQKSDLPKTEAMIREKFEEIKNTEIPAQHKSWKCKAFCHFGRNSFKDTNVKPITEFRQGQMAQTGQPMTMCDQIAYCLQHRPMESVMKNMSAQGFSIDYYSPPGA